MPVDMLSGQSTIDPRLEIAAESFNVALMSEIAAQGRR